MKFIAIELYYCFAECIIEAIWSFYKFEKNADSVRQDGLLGRFHQWLLLKYKRRSSDLSNGQKMNINQDTRNVTCNGETTPCLKNNNLVSESCDHRNMSCEGMWWKNACSNVTSLSCFTSGERVRWNGRGQTDTRVGKHVVWVIRGVSGERYQQEHPVFLPQQLWGENQWRLCA